jgi:uncharacterized membrane protein (UPF0127 family)
MPITARHVVGVAMGLVLALSLVWTLSERRPRPAPIELAAPTGTLRVELAKTPAARAAGLSNRDAVTGNGLLLHWDTPGRHPIWMAEMRFALDLVWLDERGNVLAVLDSVPPCNQQPCPLYEPPHTDAAIAVLELPAGDAKRRGIVVGAVLRRADGSRP